MNERRVEDNLHVIRTLMERTALYRRALAPMLTMAGGVGTVAAIIGWRFQPDFALYWGVTAVVVVAGAFYLSRRQALKDREPLWSAPARRVVHAMAPALIAGVVLTLAACLGGNIPAIRLALIWVILYGCSLHAAGFFAPGKLRLLGWLCIGGGGALFLLVSLPGLDVPPRCAHAVMGAFFGLLHLAFGVCRRPADKEPSSL